MTNSPETPEEIRRRSRQIVRERLGLSEPLSWRDRLREAVVQTSGDVGMADRLVVHRNVREAVTGCFESGMPLVTDVTMIQAGLRDTIPLESVCYVHDEEVRKRAREANTTRSATAIRKAIRNHERFMLVVGNAPTALFAFLDAGVPPDRVPAVVACPVGFVSVEESKQALLERERPALVIDGTRGGSALAATLVNTLWSCLGEVSR
jgi:precorrin-8X/cobalt-precorrin-8 methylmutase